MPLRHHLLLTVQFIIGITYSLLESGTEARIPYLNDLRNQWQTDSHDLWAGLCQGWWAGGRYQLLHQLRRKRNVLLIQRYQPLEGWGALA